MNLDLYQPWNEIGVYGFALQHERFHSQKSIRERKKEMSRMVWWMDFLSIAMLATTGGWLILMFADMITVSGLLPVQTLALVAAAASKELSCPREKRRNDNMLR